MHLTEQKDGWSIGLQGGRVGYIHIDFRLGLDLTVASGTVSVIIETPFILCSSGSQKKLTPAETTSLALLWRCLTSTYWQLPSCEQGV